MSHEVASDIWGVLKYHELVFVLSVTMQKPCYCLYYKAKMHCNGNCYFKLAELLLAWAISQFFRNFSAGNVFRIALTNNFIFNINLHVSGSVLPLGKMELNPVVGLVLLSKATTVSDNKPSLADLDSDTDSEDDQGKFLNN